MTNYRRLRAPGATYFFTVNAIDRRSDVLTRHIEELRSAVRWVHGRLPFHIDAWVVLPEHMHCLWTLPPEDTNYSRRWQAIKTAFSKSMPAEEPRSASRIAKHERGIWQRRYWEHTIRNDDDYTAHADYIHFNPVKHGLVATPAQWPFSSFHRWVRQGMYPAGWCADQAVNIEAGEREEAIE
jgi:putative transposase